VIDRVPEKTHKLHHKFTTVSRFSSVLEYYFKIQQTKHRQSK